MKLSMRELICAAALGTLALGAHAEMTGASKTTGAAGTDMRAQADADYKAAKAACDAKTGTDKANCLKNAKASYDRSLSGLKAGDTSGNAPGGTAGATGGTAGATGGTSSGPTGSEGTSSGAPAGNTGGAASGTSSGAAGGGAPK